MRRKCTEKLIIWKKSPVRKPLVLQGGRQTGKTWLLRDFGSRQYEDTIYINLETDKPVADFLQTPREPDEMLLFLESYANKPIRQGSTLLILDNLQAVPQAAKLLPGIGMEFPNYHIAAIERGRFFCHDINEVEIIQLYPLDFEEFLWANMEYGLAKEIREHFLQMKPMRKALHEKAMSQFRLYLAIGGMPAAILEYRKEKKLLLVPDIQEKILQLYLADITAEAPEGTAHHARNCFLSVPAQLCKENSKFQYRQIVKGGTAKIYQVPLKWLTETGMVYQSLRKTGTGNEETAAFRLYLPDTGLSACRMGIPSYMLLLGENNRSMRGLVETFLAQCFIQNQYKLTYWDSGNQAELPFLLERDGEVIAVDFRLDAGEKVRNLSRYRECCQGKKMYLISVEDFRPREMYDIVPVYAGFCI